MKIRDKGYIPFIVAQFLFLMAAWPYLSGELVFAPKAYVAEREFRMDGLVDSKITARDTFGAEDYLDQERIFLRFYRDSLRNGELPFWNEHTFGGISQENSMIFSYLSPFALPWLFIGNDHMAKGVQIFLLLNFGALAMIWWCRILGVGDAWTLAAIALGTLMPLAMHFQAHIHQPALYYTGLIVLAAFHRLLETGRRKYMAMFFGAVCLAIACNFLSALLFISIALAMIAMAHFGWRRDERRVVLGRTLLAATLYGLALASLAFFLGPILLESHLVREPTTYIAGSFAPWGGVYSLVDAISYFGLGHSVWLPLAATLPIFIMFRQREAGGLQVAELTGRGLMLYFLFVVLVSSVGPFIMLFRSYFPGMEYSANGTFRLVYFANLCMIPVMAKLFTQLGDASAKVRRMVLAILAFEFMAGLAVWLVTQPLPGGLGHIAAIEKAGDLLRTRGLVESAGVSALVALAFLVLAAQSARRKATLAFLAATSVGLGLVWIYTYQRPNLPVTLDPAAHPIFAGIPQGSRVMTLEDCSSSTRSYYRSEAALAGMDALDGPTDLGLFIRTRRFWDAWNDIPALNRQGANLMEVMWICSEHAVKPDGIFNPAFGALMRLVGTEYLFTDREIRDPEVNLAAQVGALRAYRLAWPQWPRISFLPGVEMAQFQDVVTGLSRGDGSKLTEFERFERIRQDLHAEKVDNLHWRAWGAPSLLGKTGLLFMNSPVEYTNGLEVPFIHLPLEGKWVIERSGQTTDFAMINVPFRMAELSIGVGAMEIRYTLKQYYFWAVISLAGLAGFVFVIRKYGRQ